MIVEVPFARFDRTIIAFFVTYGRKLTRSSLIADTGDWPNISQDSSGTRIVGDKQQQLDGVVSLSFHKSVNRGPLRGDLCQVTFAK